MRLYGLVLLWFLVWIVRMFVIFWFEVRIFIVVVWLKKGILSLSVFCVSIFIINCDV